MEQHATAGVKKDCAQENLLSEIIQMKTTTSGEQIKEQHQHSSPICKSKTTDKECAQKTTTSEITSNITTPEPGEQTPSSTKPYAQQKTTTATDHPTLSSHQDNNTSPVHNEKIPKEEEIPPKTQPNYNNTKSPPPKYPPPCVHTHPRTTQHHP